MVDPTKYRGDVGRPMGPEPEKEQQVDPEKFKKVLKVEKVDETEKRQQRRLKKGEGEGDEDEEVEESAPPPPASSFADFLGDKNELDNLFDAQSPGIRQQAAPQTTMQAPAPGSISTEGVDFEEGPSTQQAEPQSAPSPYQPQQPSPKEPPPQQSEQQSPSYSQSQEEPTSYPEIISQYPGNSTDQIQSDQTTEPKQQTQPTESNSQQEKEHSPKKKEEDVSLLASQPAKDALKSKKKAPKKAAPRIKTVTPTKEEEAVQPTPLKKRETLPERQSTEQPLAQSPPKANKETTVSPLTDTPVPIEAKKGKKAAEKPLEAPIGEEVNIPLVPKGDLVLNNEKEGLTLGGVSESEAPLATTPNPMQTPHRSKPQTNITFERFTPEQIRNRKRGISPSISKVMATEESSVSPPLIGGEMGQMGDKKKDKKEDFPFINSDELTAALPPMEQTLPPVTPPATAPAYSQLSPQTYELFEKMVGTIIVQHQSGVTSTTITLNMPNSVFNGAQVIFEQYSTAPNSYNLQLVGTPQAVDVFNANMGDLVAAFKQSQHAFEVNILKPVLEGKKPLIRRKGAAGDNGGKSKR